MTASPGAVAVSTPGKLILSGEHAVVYGRPALVSAIDLRLTARLAAAPDAAPGGLRLALPGLGCSAETSWAEVRAYARQARARWEGYAASPAPQAFRALRGEDPIHLVKVALGEAAEHLAGLAGLAETGAGVAPAAALRVDSDLPPGSGFGSSAAAAAAVVAATLALLGTDSGFDVGLDSGVDNRLDTIERLVHEVERRQHGTPSGVDAATVLRGGVLWARRPAAGGSTGGRALAIEPVALRSPALARLAVYDTGAPAEATGAVVAAVRERRARDRAGVERLLDRMAEAAAAFRAALEAGGEAAGGLRDPIALGEECLEALGVVPAPVARIVRRIEAAGGAAKISGAGALSGDGAGALLVYDPGSSAEPGHGDLEGALATLPLRPVRFGAPGLRREAP